MNTEQKIALIMEIDTYEWLYNATGNEAYLITYMRLAELYNKLNQ